jgi:hypothetical protein
MNRLLVAYLTFSLCTAPAWCCCTLRALGSNQSSYEPRTTIANQNGECCCCHGSKSKPARRSEEPCRPSQDRDSSCTCKPVKNQAVLPEKPVEAKQLNTSVGELPCSPAFWWTPADLFARPAITDHSRQSIAFPFLSGRDVLRALHLLLC